MRQFTAVTRDSYLGMKVSGELDGFDVEFREKLEHKHLRCSVCQEVLVQDLVWIDQDLRAYCPRHRRDQ